MGFQLEYIIMSSNDTKGLSFFHLIIIISKTRFWFKEILSYILMSEINKNMKMSKTEFCKLEKQVDDLEEKVYKK